MSIPLFLPIPVYAPIAPSANAMTIRALCARAGVACKASGTWVNRPIDIVTRPNAPLSVVAAPGDWGVVRITQPETNRVKAAQVALAVMAYAIHDVVCRQSIAGQPWAKIAMPRGRLKKARVASNAERQRKFREGKRENAN